MSPICSGNHKTRLFIGEGNFSYTGAFIRKHDEKFGHDASNSLARSIISTDLVDRIHCRACDLISSSDNQAISPSGLSSTQTACDGCVVRRIEHLKSIGVRIILGVDATSLSTRDEFRGRNIPRIHWNCPHDGKSVLEQTLPKIISDFFKECRQIQDTEGRIHITLAQPGMPFYQGLYYNITKAASENGYTLIKKRKFEMDRYPGYQHTQTNSREKARVTAIGMREFIFKKVADEAFEAIKEAAKNAEDSDELQIEKKVLEGLQEISNKNCTIVRGKAYYDLERLYYTCSSDEDSSDCEL